MADNNFLIPPHAFSSNGKMTVDFSASIANLPAGTTVQVSDEISPEQAQAVVAILNQKCGIVIHDSLPELVAMSIVENLRPGHRIHLSFTISAALAKKLILALPHDVIFSLSKLPAFHSLGVASLYTEIQQITAWLALLTHRHNIELFPTNIDLLETVIKVLGTSKSKIIISSTFIQDELARLLVEFMHKHKQSYYLVANLESRLEIILFIIANLPSDSCLIISENYCMEYTRACLQHLPSNCNVYLDALPTDTIRQLMGRLDETMRVALPYHTQADAAPWINFLPSDGVVVINPTWQLDVQWSEILRQLIAQLRLLPANVRVMLHPDSVPAIAQACVQHMPSTCSLIIPPALQQPVLTAIAENITDVSPSLIMCSSVLARFSAVPRNMKVTNLYVDSMVPLRSEFIQAITITGKLVFSENQQLSLYKDLCTCLSDGATITLPANLSPRQFQETFFKAHTPSAAPLVSQGIKIKFINMPLLSALFPVSRHMPAIKCSISGALSLPKDASEMLARVVFPKFSDGSFFVDPGTKVTDLKKTIQNMQADLVPIVDLMHTKTELLEAIIQALPNSSSMEYIISTQPLDCSCFTQSQYRHVTQTLDISNLKRKLKLCAKLAQLKKISFMPRFLDNYLLLFSVIAQTEQLYRLKFPVELKLPEIVRYVQNLPKCIFTLNRDALPRMSMAALELLPQGTCVSIPKSFNDCTRLLTYITCLPDYCILELPEEIDLERARSCLQLLKKHFFILPPDLYSTLAASSTETLSTGCFICPHQALPLLLANTLCTPIITYAKGSFEETISAIHCIAQHSSSAEEISDLLIKEIIKVADLLTQQADVIRRKLFMERTAVVETHYRYLNRARTIYLSSKDLQDQDDIKFAMLMNYFGRAGMQLHLLIPIAEAYERSCLQTIMLEEQLAQQELSDIMTAEAQARQQLRDSIKTHQNSRMFILLDLTDLSLICKIAKDLNCYDALCISNIQRGQHHMQPYTQDSPIIKSLQCCVQTLTQGNLAINLECVPDLMLRFLLPLIPPNCILSFLTVQTSYKDPRFFQYLPPRCQVLLSSHATNIYLLMAACQSRAIIIHLLILGGDYSVADKFTPITPTIVAELAQSVLKKCSPLVVHVNSFSDQKLIYSYARHADATIVHNHRAPYLEPDVGSLAVQDCRYKDNHICKCL